jgi:HEPN domain-containing protein
MDYANEDLCLAEYGLNMESGCPFRLIAYHAQQCVEKYLKAFLVYCRQDFPFTHNISTLLELCRIHADWADSLSEAEKLTPYAVTARYPGEAEVVTLDEASNAVRTARQVKSLLYTLLDNAIQAEERP